MLRSVVAEVKLYAEDQIHHIRKLSQIGLALSAEKEIGKLLELIVDEARELSFADAGTLYILDRNTHHLRFEILQNESMKTRMGGTSGIPISFPQVPLYIDGHPNRANVSSYVAIEGEIVNIPDVYEAEGFDFTGPRKYDHSTGYRSKSMLVIPMKNHENDIIGVLQLLNAQDPETKQVVPFSTDYVDLVGSLASQAAVALTNAQLIQDLKNLLDAFIRSIATAIDEKSPYTGGHINRVVDLTMMVVDHINAAQDGRFKGVFFNDEEKEELRMAAWMHDVGKITTPEWVVDKSTKLQSIVDRVHLIEDRFSLIEMIMENALLQRKIAATGSVGQDSVKAGEMDEAHLSELASLRDDLEFIKSCNQPGEFISDEKLDRLKNIAAKTFVHANETRPYLTENEVLNLSIRKGSLSGPERKIIENHATMTRKILEKLPFPKKLANVPKYAGGHHEKVDGSGYPERLSENDLPLQARIMALADVFEALTAKDRPYKPPMKLSQAIKIMGFMKDDKHIDPDIFELFINNNLHHKYAQKEMNPEQIDIKRDSE